MISFRCNAATEKKLKAIMKELQKLVPWKVTRSNAVITAIDSYKLKEA